MRNGNFAAVVTVQGGEDIAACIEPINRFADRVGVAIVCASTRAKIVGRFLVQGPGATLARISDQSGYRDGLGDSVMAAASKAAASIYC